MKRPNAQVMRLLEEEHPRSLTANQVVRRTKLSFTAVRNTLNLAYEQRSVDCDLDIGLNGHSIRRWWYCRVACAECAGKKGD